MKVHHFNCGSMRPWGAPRGLVCHVLLIEAGRGLVLVDSGLGLLDAAAPGRRFGFVRHFVRPVFAEHETAVRQVQNLGYDPADVRDIILTHFDADHAGGLADFPHARVHLTAAENQASLHPRTQVEKGRYRRAQRAHQPMIIEHHPAEGESWQGFASAVELTDVAAGVVLIALPGHTRGHAAVAVDAGDHWVLHVGDAFYDRAQIGDHGRAPLSLLAMERLVAADWSRVKANHVQLQELWAHADRGLILVNAHDPALLDRARAATSR